MSSGSEIPTVQPAGVGQTVIIREVGRGSTTAKVLAWLFGTLLLVSLLANCILAGLIGSLAPGPYADRLPQKYHGGNASSNQVVALVRLEGVILEGSLDYIYKQFRDAAQDEHVKAVVLAINSPGGTVTGSELLHEYVQRLRAGKWEKQSAAKPVVTYIESLAASGGYFVAAASDHIVAQPGSITGSIGVYAAILDLHKLAEKYGVAMHVIKRGELKGPTILHEMTPEERQQWELLVGEAYTRFQEVVTAGRGAKLQAKLREPFQLKTDTGEVVTRRIADGGVFTARQAKEIGLVDDLGFLPDAIEKAAELANLSDYKVIQYKRPTFFSEILESRDDPRPALSDWPMLTMRLWYLTPGYELAPLPIGELVRLSATPAGVHPGHPKP